MKIIFALQSMDVADLQVKVEEVLRYFKTDASFPSGVYTLIYEPVVVKRPIGRPKTVVPGDTASKRPVGRPRTVSYAQPNNQSPYRVARKPTGVNSLSFDLLDSALKEYGVQTFNHPMRSCFVIDNRSGEIIREYKGDRSDPIIDMSGV
jgi:hypothetical protein